MPWENNFQLFMPNGIQKLHKHLQEKSNRACLRGFGLCFPTPEIKVVRRGWRWTEGTETLTAEKSLWLLTKAACNQP